MGKTFGEATVERIESMIENGEETTRLCRNPVGLYAVLGACLFGFYASYDAGDLHTLHQHRQHRLDSVAHAQHQPVPVKQTAPHHKL